jgi:putative endonuclease
MKILPTVLVHTLISISEEYTLSSINLFYTLYRMFSETAPDDIAVREFPQCYVCVTSNLEERLEAHNAGASLHTSKYRPRKVVMYLCFQDDRRAIEFERYLKTGSGQAFPNKRLW